MNKEQVYDEKINPLMAQIIAICQEHKIAALCTFAIPTDEDDCLQCSTNLPDETGAAPEHHARAFAAIPDQGGRAVFAETRNGELRSGGRAPS